MNISWRYCYLLYCNVDEALIKQFRRENIGLNFVIIFWLIFICLILLIIFINIFLQSVVMLGGSVQSLQRDIRNLQLEQDDARVSVTDVASLAKNNKV